MDLTNLKALVAFLQASGVQYYKDANVELILTASRPGAIISSPAPEKAEPLPAVYRKLPPNYSNPNLFPKGD